MRLHLVISKDNPLWNENKEIMLMFFRAMEHRFNDFIRAYGYLYFSYIYRYFGLDWDPNKFNMFYTYEPDNFIVIDVLPFKDGDYQLIIHTWD